MSLTTTRRGFIKGGAGLSLAAAASLYMAGCSGPAGEGKVLRYGCANPKVSLDLQTNTSNEIGVAESICEPLIRFNEKLEMEPVLLTKMPEISADGLTYTFELKDKLPVHDGSNLTANDVKFTFTRMFLPSTKNPPPTSMTPSWAPKTSWMARRRSLRALPSKTTPTSP